MKTPTSTSGTYVDPFREVSEHDRIGVRGRPKRVRYVSVGWNGGWCIVTFTDLTSETYRPGDSVWRYDR